MRALDPVQRGMLSFPSRVVSSTEMAVGLTRIDWSASPLIRDYGDWDLSRNNLTGTVPPGLPSSYFDLNCLDDCIHQRQPWCQFPADPAQTKALEALFASTNGPSWINHTGWLQGDPCQEQWFGVGWQPNQAVSPPCYVAVTQLDLPANSLRGTLPAALSALSALQYVTLCLRKAHVVWEVGRHYLVPQVHL